MSVSRSESTGVSKPSVFNTDNFRLTMLNKHNELRRKHSTEKLQLDAHLNNIAQKYADKLTRTGTFKHGEPRERGHSGENLYYSCGMEITGAIVTHSWYNEIKDYNWNQPSKGDVFGHFTQV